MDYLLRGFASKAPPTGPAGPSWAMAQAGGSAQAVNRITLTSGPSTMLSAIRNNHALKGVLWGIGGTAGQSIFQMVVFIILARALSPGAFGIVAMATAIIDILNFIGRGGIAEVLIQRKELTPRALNSGFMSSLIVGGVLTLTLFALAPVFARLFRTAELAPVMAWLAPVCVLYAMGAVYEAKLRHAYQFKQLALRNTTATLVSGAVSMAMALKGFGVYALIAQRLISTVWTLVAMAVATRWLPRLDVDTEDMVRQLKQGSAIALSSVLGIGNQRLLDLVVGYFLGPVQLGYLRIAWRMLDLVLEVAVRPISNVSLTALSKARHFGRGVADSYCSLLRYSAILIVPTFLGLAVTSYAVIPLVFGAKWAVSGNLLSILCLMGFCVPLIYFKSNALIASGAYRHVIVLNVTEFLLSMAVAFGSAPFGLVSATTGNVVRTILITPVILLYLQRVVGISAWRSLRAVLPACGAGLGMALIVQTLRRALPASWPAYGNLATCVIVGGAVYGVLLLLLDRQLLADLLRSRRTSPAVDPAAG